MAAIEAALTADDPGLAERLSCGWHRREVPFRFLWIGTLLALGFAPIAGAAGVGLHSLACVGAASVALLTALAAIAALCMT